MGWLSGMGQFRWFILCPSDPLDLGFGDVGRSKQVFGFLVTRGYDVLSAGLVVVRVLAFPSRQTPFF